MTVRIQTWSGSIASCLAVVVGGCEVAYTEPAGSTVSGLVKPEAGVALVVALQDSSPQPYLLQTTPDGKGSYAFDVSGLRAPFLLSAEVMSSTGTTQLYSVAGGSASPAAPCRASSRS